MTYLLTYSLTYYFAPHLSAYRASYSTEHVLLHLIEEWKTNFDNKFAVGMVLKLLTGHLTTFGLLILLPTDLRENITL